MSSRAEVTGAPIVSSNVKVQVKAHAVEVWGLLTHVLRNVSDSWMENGYCTGKKLRKRMDMYLILDW